MSSTKVSNESKNFVYCCIILAILLYGSETWCLTETLLQELRCFHARCVRNMCRVKRWHTRKHHISTSDLLARLKLDTIDKYINKRQLRWAGHVARVNDYRIPKRLLFGELVEGKRKQCGVKFRFKENLKKNLNHCSINPS